MDKAVLGFLCGIGVSIMALAIMGYTPLDGEVHTIKIVHRPNSVVTRNHADKRTVVTFQNKREAEEFRDQLLKSVFAE